MIIFEKTGTPQTNHQNSNEKLKRIISRRLSLWTMDYQSIIGEHDPIEWLCFSSNLRKLFKQNMKKRLKKTIEKTHFSNLPTNERSGFRFE